MSLLLDTVEALATPHGLDRYLELVRPMWTVRELRAQVVAVDRRGDGSVTLTLRPTRQWRGFDAGQFVQLAVDIDGVRRTRCYSPASSEHRPDGRIELTIKAHPQGIVSQYLHTSAQPGLVVGMTQADGSFRLPLPRPRRVVLVSGGSGITPVMSMLRTLLDEQHAGPITFVHYAKDARQVPYLDELRALAAAHANLEVAFGFSAQDVGGELAGRFGLAHLQQVAPWYRDAEIFVCGPEGLRRAVHDACDDLDAGATGPRVRSEAFVLAPSAPAEEDVSGVTTFARSARTAPNTGATLLDQAEAAGLTPEHGCRMGICFSCTKVRNSGCTRNIRTGELDDDPGVEVQLCINHAVGDVVIDL